MNLFSVIKQKLSILDVIADYATLKKAGNYYKGCCPFHHERTASFTVSPHKEIFYCFGCHVGGDVISFIAKIEHCSPLEAARHLVERYAINIPENISWEKSTDSYEAKKSYHKTCDVFARWCMGELQKNSLAQEYLLKRSISHESIKEFGLGYCSSQVKNLLTYAQKEGILAQNFLDAHVIKESKIGLYLSFDERIIFPIKDHLGSIVGFGGRTFKDGDDRAKYYNSHEHAHFNKGTLLFGLDRAKKAIAEQETAFLVEGYTDLILMHQYGYTNTIATLGTACTFDHLKHLARYAQKLNVMYDGDTAGQNAIMRLVELCWEVSIDPYVITLPTEDDPASYLVKHKTLEEPLAKPLDIFSFVVNHLTDDFKNKSMQGKLAATQRILTLIRGIKDPLKRELLLQQAEGAFGVPVQTLKQTMDSYKVPQVAHQVREFAQPLLQTSDLVKRLFSAILNGNAALTESDIELLSLLLEEPVHNIFTAWQATQTNMGVDISRLFEHLTQDEKAFVSHCLASDLQTLLPEHLIHLYKKQWKKKIHDVKLKVLEAEKQGERDQVAQLLIDLNALKSKMLGRGIV